MRPRAVAGFLCAALVGALGTLPVGSSAPAEPATPEGLPALGTRLAPFPDGPGKSIADAACLSCHAADLIRQQRLTAKQWDANLTKMAGWGAVIPEDQREALLAYLLTNFGPDNDRFEPVETQPSSR